MNKWIKSFKLFEAELNRYGYEGDIIDIDKNELQECIDCLNKLFIPLFGPGMDNEIVTLDTYKDSDVIVGMNDYAYCAAFSDKIIDVDGKHDYILAKMANILFKPISRQLDLLLLTNHSTYDVEYSVIFTNKENFRTKLSKPSSKVKVPKNKESVLISMICYYTAHLEERIGNEISYEAGDEAGTRTAPIFKNLIINYCNYLLSLNRSGRVNLFNLNINIDDVYLVLYKTISEDKNQYGILTTIKNDLPELYQQLSKVGDIKNLDSGSKMGEMGF